MTDRIGAFTIDTTSEINLHDVACKFITTKRSILLLSECLDFLHVFYDFS